MKVTDKQYYMERLKVQVLDFLCSRVSDPHKFQNVIITDGKEGEGKSTLTAGDAYYMAYRLRRELRLFFDLESLKDYAINNEDKIIIWDDVALAGLSMEAYNSQIIELIKILMLARKKRNTFFFNIQELIRMKEPLVDRAICLNHVYSPDKKKLGKYCYYNEAQLNLMYRLYRHKKKRTYKHFSFRGSFPNVLGKIFDEKEYDALKDKAIQSINAKKDKSKSSVEKALFDDLRYRLATSSSLNQDMMDQLGITKDSIKNWKRRYSPLPDGQGTQESASIITKNGLSIGPKDESYLKLRPDFLYAHPIPEEEDDEDPLFLPGPSDDDDFNKGGILRR